RVSKNSTRSSVMMPCPPTTAIGPEPTGSACCSRRACGGRGSPMGRYVLVIDEGTTGTRALIFDQKGDIRSQAYTEFTQYHPAPDRVEHDAVEIWEKTLAMCRRAL